MTVICNYNNKSKFTTFGTESEHKMANITDCSETFIFFVPYLKFQIDTKYLIFVAVTEIKICVTLCFSTFFVLNT